MIIYSEKLLSITHQLLIDNPEILDIIRDRKFKIGDTKMSYRQLNHLDQAGLVDESRKSDKQWRTFNITDLLYLNVVMNLRGFDVKNDKIKYIQKMFYQPNINFKDVGGITDAEIAIVGLMLEVVPIGILVFIDGEAILTDNPDISYLQGHLDIKNRPHIFIMLFETFKDEIKKLLNDENIQSAIDLQNYKSKYLHYPLSDKDHDLLAFVKDAKYSKIIIEKKSDGRFFLKGKKDKNGPTITTDDILKLINSKQYGGVGLRMQAGKIAYLEDTDTKVI